MYKLKGGRNEINENVRCSLEELFGCHKMAQKWADFDAIEIERGNREKEKDSIEGEFCVDQFVCSASISATINLF